MKLLKSGFKMRRRLCFKWLTFRFKLSSRWLILRWLPLKHMITFQTFTFKMIAFLDGYFFELIYYPGSNCLIYFWT